MSRCAALGCSSFVSNTSLHFFPIPIKPRLKRTWERNIGRNDLPLSSLICQNHFTPLDFDSKQDENGKLLLKASAVPSMFGSIVSKVESSPMRRSNRHRRPKKQLEEYLSTKKNAKTLDVKLAPKSGNRMDKHFEKRLNKGPSKLDCPSTQTRRGVLNERDERGEAIAEWYLMDIFEATKYIISALPPGSKVTEELITKLEETVIDIISKLIHRISSVIITSFEEEFGKGSKVMKGLKSVYNHTSERLEIMKQQDVEGCNVSERGKVDLDEAMFEQMLKELDPTLQENPVFEEDELLKEKKAQTPLLSCSKCKFKSRIKSRLRKHVLKHLFTKRYECSNCNYSFNTLGSLKKHLRTHTGSKPFDCRLCNYRTANSSNLLCHQSTHHNRKAHKCPHCSHTSSQRLSLVSHIKAVHKPNVQGGKDRCLKDVYICSECSYVSESHFRLKEHLKSHCFEERRFSQSNSSLINLDCQANNDNAGRSCVDTKATEEHLSIVPDLSNLKSGNHNSSDSAQAVESTGNQRNNSNQSILPTMLLDDSVTFRCNKCDYMTDKVSCFTQHKISHFDEKWFKCDLCEKTFRLQSNLKNHLKGNHGR